MQAPAREDGLSELEFQKDFLRLTRSTPKSLGSSFIRSVPLTVSIGKKNDRSFGAGKPSEEPSANLGSESVQRLSHLGNETHDLFRVSRPYPEGSGTEYHRYAPDRHANDGSLRAR